MMSQLKGLIDIAANLTDPLFQGVSHKGRTLHTNDFDLVLQRAWSNNVEKIVVLGCSLGESRQALQLAQQHDRLFCTIGCHPSRCLEFVNHKDSGNDSPESYLRDLMQLAKDGMRDRKVIAIGECGLDYAELNECPKEIQIQYFEKQFALAKETSLPMYFHCRDAADDFIRIVRENRRLFGVGIVHSFTGSESDLMRMLDLDLYFGVNGCSLKTEANMRVMSRIPMDRLMLETDAPWCDVLASHAGYSFVQTHFPSRPKEKFELGKCVNRRSEPCHVRQIAEIVAGYRGLELQDVIAQIHDNTNRVLFPADVLTNQKEADTHFQPNNSTR